MDQLVAMARGHQPHLIVVDRTVGRFEDYRTPEQEVPERPLPYVWETCMTMGDQWSYKPDDKYKSTRQLIHLLVGHRGQGRQPAAEHRAAAGRHACRRRPCPAWRRSAAGWTSTPRRSTAPGPCAPYKEGQVALTRKGGTIYAIYLAGEQEQAPPAQVRVPSLKPEAGSQVRLLGCDQPCGWRLADDGLQIDVPAAARSKPPCQHAWVFQVQGGTAQQPGQRGAK